MTHIPAHSGVMLPVVVQCTFIIFGVFTMPDLCPLTQNSGDATADRRVMPCSTGRLLIVINGECLALTGICALLSVILAITIFKPKCTYVPRV